MIRTEAHEPKRRKTSDQSSLTPGWTRSTGGYAWRDDLSLGESPQSLVEAIGGQRWLVPRSHMALSEAYTPLVESVGLYREFAALNARDSIYPETGKDGDSPAFDEAVLVFASRYGMLTGGRALWVADLQPYPARGEAAYFWRVEAYEAARLVWLWDLVRDYEFELDGEDARERLAAHSREDETGAWWIEYNHAPPKGLIQIQDLVPVPDGAPIEHTYFGWRKTPDRPWQFVANLALASPPAKPVVSPRARGKTILMAELNTKLALYPSRAQLIMRQSGPATGHEVSLIPESLIATIYAQIAHEFQGGPQARSCADCGVWFHPTRRDARYHSGACRARASRKRRAQ